MAEARGFSERFDEHGFAQCVVKVGARIFIDREAVMEGLDKQQAQPQPHQRGIARKRLAETRHSPALAVSQGETNKASIRTRGFVGVPERVY